MDLSAIEIVDDDKDEEMPDAAAGERLQQGGPLRTQPAVKEEGAEDDKENDIQSSEANAKGPKEERDAPANITKLEQEIFKSFLSLKRVLALFLVLVFILLPGTEAGRLMQRWKRLLLVGTEAGWLVQRWGRLLLVGTVAGWLVQRWGRPLFANMEAGRLVRRCERLLRTNRPFNYFEPRRQDLVATLEVLRDKLGFVRFRNQAVACLSANGISMLHALMQLKFKFFFMKTISGGPKATLIERWNATGLERLMDRANEEDDDLTLKTVIKYPSTGSLADVITCGLTVFAYPKMKSPDLAPIPPDLQACSVFKYLKANAATGENGDEFDNSGENGARRNRPQLKRQRRGRLSTSSFVLELSGDELVDEGGVPSGDSEESDSDEDMPDLVDNEDESSSNEDEDDEDDEDDRPQLKPKKAPLKQNGKPAKKAAAKSVPKKAASKPKKSGASSSSSSSSSSSFSSSSGEKKKSGDKKKMGGGGSTA
uniref:Uncharacterized protein n=1 Tax=Chromera velia CCMP2878 TaxID=1169474 RepID=A0A0G4GNX4_9ALVE|eukprot:Cvel_22729.t1-p1 / transcript=Cvel_22729.t1 / gene=Cvel_22729 / organism=Chromera_velia_CCMP2878 / gene_product=hypothetical protein / transcript_product=hypothetical protein / location=Cvel_scaffold2265:18255-27377(+) / protein_length=481 / sequence_SO=supercontig / SO=protein_coding / is_pseudo=false